MQANIFIFIFSGPIWRLLGQCWRISFQLTPDPYTVLTPTSAPIEHANEELADPLVEVVAAVIV
jgi:hypothetical protein